MERDFKREEKRRLQNRFPGQRSCRIIFSERSETLHCLELKWTWDGILCNNPEDRRHSERKDKQIGDEDSFQNTGERKAVGPLPPLPPAPQPRHIILPLLWETLLTCPGSCVPPSPLPLSLAPELCTRPRPIPDTSPHV